MQAPTAAHRQIVLQANSPEHDIAAYVDYVREHPEHRDSLVSLLPYDHLLYTGRGANQVTRIRGYILASFEQTGLPNSALIYVLDELENSQRPYLVAAAARALRGINEWSAELVPFLLTAVTNIQYRDDALSFESYKTTWPNPNHTTALSEILFTFECFGAQANSALPSLEAMKSSSVFSRRVRRQATKAVVAIRSDRRAPPPSCCTLPSGKCSTANSWKRHREVELIDKVQFEDQDGRVLTYAEAFRGKPSVVAFFYTRCANPNKCSLTVSKLAELQSSLAARNLTRHARIAAVSYDPGHDTPELLRGYCQNRGFTFDADNCAWRVDPGNFDAVRGYFELGANFSGSVVSRHRIELFILDSIGEVVATYTNLQWDVCDVADEVTKVLMEQTAIAN